ncbi:MAG: HAMP domain-containing sensor histidine kinase [Gemmatimonadota bacterium]
MSISARLWSGFAALFLLLLALVISHEVALRELASSQRQVAEVAAMAAVTGIEQVGWLDRMRESAAKHAVTGDTGYARLFRSHRDRFDASLRSLDSLPLPPEIRRAVEEAGTIRASLPPLDSLPHGGDEEIGRLRGASLALAEAARSVIRASAREAASAVTRLERVSLGVSAGSLLLGFLVFGLAIRSITGSLGRLGDAAHALAAGDFDYRIEGLSRDREFRRLEQDFNVMIGRLGEIDRLKTDFLSSVSHDLKSPLASMQEIQNLLLERTPGPLTERQERLLRLGARSGERLSAMISQLLDLARMEAGAVRMDVRPEDLAAIARDVAHRARPASWEDAGIAVRTDFPDRLPFEGDAGRIAQVLENLLSNAFRYAPDESEIRVRGWVPDGRPPEVPTGTWEAVVDGRSDRRPILVSVEDRGPGVADEMKSSVFERFVQAGPSSRSTGGVGLGLAICREIVTAHGGRIWVADREGGGSAFRFLLPGSSVADESARHGEGDEGGTR